MSAIQKQYGAIIPEAIGLLYSHIQQKELIICQLKDQILGDKRSCEENQQRMATDSDAIMKEKKNCMREIVELKNSIEKLESNLVQTREESGKSLKVKSKKLNELMHSLQESRRLRRDNMEKIISSQISTLMHRKNIINESVAGSHKTEDDPVKLKEVTKIGYGRADDVTSRSFITVTTEDGTESDNHDDTTTISR